MRPRPVKNWLAFALAAVLAAGGSAALAQPPTLNGDVLSVPVIQIGGDYYRADLTLIPGTDPVELTVTDGAQISASNPTDVSSFADNLLSIPSITVDNVEYYASFALVGEDPYIFRLQDAGEVSGDSRDEALNLFEQSLATTVQVQCVACHTADGPARSSALILQRESASSTLNNFAAFESLLGSREDGREHILARVSGTDHPGGNQFPINSANYNALDSMLSLLDNSGSGGGGNSVLFLTGVTLKSNVETLRRAAIHLAGRLPTDAEIAAVSSGADADLRVVLRDLMTGPGFHQFLLDGANDRLLLRGIRDFGLLDGCEVCFPAFVNQRNVLALDNLANDRDWSFEMGRYMMGIDYGLKEGALELIAHVVENERPYSEILTADYAMYNPVANLAVEGTAQFTDPENYSEFQPGIMTGAYSPSPDADYEELDNIDSVQVNDPGPLRITFPHSGLLNSQAFLARYPTTATNRNRARARWTYLHFLDLDIERSAPRTTDPIALADTNNPTMLNDNCTVCHATMDPLAGAYQNYSDEGFYRSGWNGMDSLDPFYKWPQDDTPTLYQWGDTWYRDMRTPGLFGVNAPDSSNSIQWAAQQIVSEPGFAVATVKFWWPALIGTEVQRLPEVESDANYAAQLAAYDAQNSAIQGFAATFSSSGMNLKDLLVEMMMSPWFRAGSVDSGQLTPELIEAHQLASFGGETLLTPERLQRKTAAITGFNWNSYADLTVNRVDTGLGTLYRLYYGGINSGSVTKRATEMTPLMSTVAMTHALESACPIVLKEFLLSSDQRLLFEGIEPSTTPDNGEAAIRAKLVQLHERMLGKTFASNSQEINDAYQLFVDSLNADAADPMGGYLVTDFKRCDFWLDRDFFVGTEIEESVRQIYTGGQGYPWEGFDWDVIGSYIWTRTGDEHHTKHAWTTVITYLMTHYHYLYE